MWLVKWLVTVLAVLFAVVLIGGFLLPPTFAVTRTALVAAPPEKIYPLVADPHAWQLWSPWTRRDPAMRIEYSGPPSGVGATWRWKSRSQGDGAMILSEIEPNRRVAYELYFPDFGTTSSGELRFEPQDALDGSDLDDEWRRQEPVPSLDGPHRRQHGGQGLQRRPARPEGSSRKTLGLQARPLRSSSATSPLMPSACAPPRSRSVAARSDGSLQANGSPAAASRRRCSRRSTIPLAPCAGSRNLPRLSSGRRLLGHLLVEIRISSCS